jgi:hypothetical protein
MRPIPAAMRKTMDADPYYHKCARRSGECEGRITWEHALIYAGKQVNEPWAIVPLCVYHHLGPGMIKELNEYLAIRRATEADLAKYPRAQWQSKLVYLAGKYG